MEIHLHSTSKIVSLNGVPARIWEGYTQGGIAIHAFITRIGVDNSLNLAEFDRDLDTASEPSPEMQAISLRLLI